MTKSWNDIIQSDEFKKVIEGDELLRDLYEVQWEPEKPIYEQPGHDDYGPCRRIHVILSGMFGDELPRIEGLHRARFRFDWTEVVSKCWRKLGEARVARDIVYEMIKIKDGYD